MAQHFGDFSIAETTLVAGTRTHIARIKAGTSVGVLIEYLDVSFDALGDEAPIEVEIASEPSTAGTDGSGSNLDNRDGNYSATFLVDVFTGTSGESGHDRTKKFYIGPGGGTIPLPADVQSIKPAEIMDIYVTRKSAATGVLNMHLNGGIEE